MRRKLIPLILLVSIFLLAAAPVQASDLAISRMEVNIWPEYDQPSILVIFQISFSSITNFPARVSLRIPASAGNPYSVAMKDLDGLLYDLEYSVIPDGNWNQIEFVTSSQDLQIEFYAPYAQQANGTRNYDFYWISDYPVDSLTINIQKPKYANTITIEPYPGIGEVNPDDGLSYFSINEGSISKGSTVNLRVSYVKTNDKLSASTLPVKAVAPLASQNSLWQTLLTIFPTIWQNQSLMITFGLLLSGLILFSLLIFIVRGAKPKPNKDPGVPAESGSKAPAGSKEIYCHHCGKRARPGDVFCRTCGSKLLDS